MNLIRRLSDPPSSRGGSRCPDVWETDSGDFVVIGSDVTVAVSKNLPADADLSSEERAVLIPRDVLLSAQKRLA